MTEHLKLKKSDAQTVITELKRKDLIDHNFQIQRDSEYVYVPLIHDSVSELESHWKIIELEPVESRYRPKPRTTSGAFDLIGNIAITKIRNRAKAEALANDLLISHPVIKSVYLDRGIIGEYRLRDLELLAGENNFLAIYRENGLIFELDVSKVYFSPRLATERMFVAKEAENGDYVIDMFAGIGGFSLNMAKDHAITVTAIDSNPDAIHYLKRAVKLNSSTGTVNPIWGKAEEEMANLPHADRIVMNLPHDSRQYLGLAVEHLNPGGTIYYYEILDVENLAKRMEEITSFGLEIRKKREVHGYSASLSMYSLTATLIEA